MTAPSEEIIRQVREEYGPRVLLAFSRGKDAIASYLAIRDHFEEVIPYHLHLVPGLEFVDESLAHYEKLIGRKIYDLPHPSFYRLLRAFQFQTPAHAAVIDAAKLPEFDYPDVIRMIAAQEGVENPIAASGVRAADSPMRRVSFMKHGAISRARLHFYPVWDWNKERLLSAIEQSEFRLPVDYEIFGRSFDGLDLRFLAPLKKQRPRDYAKVLEWFPLVDLELWRFEKYGAA